MTGEKTRPKRVASRTSGRSLCFWVNMHRSRLSNIERGYIQPSPDELSRIAGALDQLVEAREKVARFAEECGWPVGALQHPVMTLPQNRPGVEVE
jgi:transcriptional regulator with XRE-family HTH domain